jgi:hypothetical protein
MLDGRMDGGSMIENYDQQGRVISRVGGPYYLAWTMPLEVGNHEAALQVRRTSGALLEFTWYSTIVC